MKKFLCIILCFSAILSLSCCSKEKVTESNATDGNIPSTQFTGSDMVQFTVPVGILGQENMNDLQTYCQENGFSTSFLNEAEQTVTFTSTKSKHKFFLYDIGLAVIKNITSVFTSEQFPYFKDITDYNEDFSEITLIVDAKKYNEDITRTLLPYYVGECCLYYQTFTEKNLYSCKVAVKDEKSGEIIDAKKYVQDNSGLEPMEEE